MRLSDFLAYDNIVVQCHDNPDADALASGYAVYLYLKKHGKRVRFIYSGRFQVHKSNLVYMIDKLEIPVEYVSSLVSPELLVMVDCQYGGGNVTVFDAKSIAFIDHHQVCTRLPEMSDVRSGLGSCSTICFDLLKKEGENINDNELLATALYYGLLTDTGGFSEVSHPLDRDLMDEARFSRSLISLFKNSNLSLDELVIAGEALINYIYVEKYHYAIVAARPCDPNILGIISDMLLEVDTVTSCLVYSILPFGVKISTRSCVREVNAGDLAAFIARGIGNGGGHLDKAGGFLQKELMGDADIPGLLSNRMADYYESTDIIYSDSFVGNPSECVTCVKRSFPIGYVELSKLIPVGSMVSVRTLEGDQDYLSDGNTYLLIGIDGEVYGVKQDKFERSYRATHEKFTVDCEYPPSVKDPLTGEKILLLPHALTCYSTGTVEIYVKKLSRRTKVFTSWDKEKYMLGEPGAYLAFRSDDLKDVYIIQENIFERSYEMV